MQKELKIRNRPEGYLYEIYYEGGGELPQELGGVFNSLSFAQNRINAYLAKRKPKRGTSKKATGD